MRILQKYRGLLLCQTLLRANYPLHCQRLVLLGPPPLILARPPDGPASNCEHPANLSGPCLWGKPAKFSGGYPQLHKVLAQGRMRKRLLHIQALPLPIQRNWQLSSQGLSECSISWSAKTKKLAHYLSIPAVMISFTSPYVAFTNFAP